MCRAGCAFVALLLMAASVGKAQEPVDIELALAVDVSISLTAPSSHCSGRASLRRSVTPRSSTRSRAMRLASRSW